jgi:threonine synthase
MKTHSGVAATLFQALAEAGINIDLISTSEIKISVAIDLDEGRRGRPRRPRGVRARQGVARPTGMRYVSTRGGTPPVGFSDAVAAGLAPDGGLFVPEELPDLGAELAGFEGLPYPELCTRFLAKFATDIPGAELRDLVGRSYARFDRPEIAPLVALAPDLHVLELFHGPTLAFKDIALQLLGNLYARQCAVRGETINVLGATSGDTGAAAIHGLMGREGMAIFILYPDGRVSPLQERQMACTGAANVHALAVDGSFDDAQAALKELFADGPFRAAHRLSAVNSINIARVLAQCVYYLHGWLHLPGGQRGTPSSWCRPAILATSSRAGCSRRWASRSADSGSRRTRTTSCTASSPAASTGSAR